ncbi:hypothetical protein SAMN05216339_11051 [Nitrosomonas eutropha]|uniref:Transcription factor zinc-finger domain-containing protein n=1 Tax=Nitrosomonas eutropha TaxID=916 RepID=A0A1I7IR94_9PROT|nr:zf-TFIIB domain-containing protein [Nitrosomonas eutropha]SFU75485.1 hypothetical protein SAMN05216339_11051 [Nitrosomonas eutropha]
MKCPHCVDTTLTMTERSGIEIDYCPQCRGVWLDRGELDKIIERTSQDNSPAVHPASRPTTPPSERYESQGDYKKKKRESFLSDLFDFD